MEWFTVTKVLWLHIAISAVDHDGVHNHLMMSQIGPAANYAISLSTDEAIDIRHNEWFRGLVMMECQSMWTLVGDENKPRHGDWGSPKRAYICNAFKLKVNDKIYALSDKRKQSKD